MWKNVKGRLIPITDDSRVKFRTSISQSLLTKLSEMAEQHDTHVNYLLENGMHKLLQQQTITYDKKLRPKDRVQYKTTYDKALLEKVREFAKDNKLFINDVIEYSTSFIDPDQVRGADYRSRIL